jgi:hypothetical protein
MQRYKHKIYFKKFVASNWLKTMCEMVIATQTKKLCLKLWHHPDGNDINFRRREILKLKTVNLTIDFTSNRIFSETHVHNFIINYQAQFVVITSVDNKKHQFDTVILHAPPHSIIVS